jgi:hypothetical protein
VRARAASPPAPGIARGLLAIGIATVVTAPLVPTAARADERVDERVDEQVDAVGDVGCPDLLVIHGPDGSVGDPSAVAITSQSFEREVPGWAAVGWQAAPGTDLTSIRITTPDGTQRHPGASSGVASRALEVAFCGTHDPTTADPIDGPADGARTTTTEDRTAPVRFDGPADPTIGTAPASVLGASFGLAVGTVVLLLSRSARRDREARR